MEKFKEVLKEWLDDEGDMSWDDAHDNLCNALAAFRAGDVEKLAEALGISID